MTLSLLGTAYRADLYNGQVAPNYGWMHCARLDHWMAAAPHLSSRDPRLPAIADMFDISCMVL